MLARLLLYLYGLMLVLSLLLDQPMGLAIAPERSRASRRSGVARSGESELSLRLSGSRR